MVSFHYVFTYIYLARGVKLFAQIKPRWTTAVYLVSYDRTQELGLSLLGRVPMLALYPHTSLVYSYYHNIQYLL